MAVLKMAKLKNVTFLELLPPNLQDDPDAIAASAALDFESTNLVNSLNKAIIFGDLDNIDDKTADLLATDLHIDYYNEDFDIVTKRKLVKNSLNWHRKKGSLKALEDVLKTVSGNVQVKEWFNYGGKAHHFKVNVSTFTGSLSTSIVSEINKVIEEYKRLSSKLDSISINRGDGVKLHYGINVKTNIKKYIDPAVKALPGTIVQSNIGAAKVVETGIDHDIAYEYYFFNALKDVDIQELKTSHDISAAGTEALPYITLSGRVNNITNEALEAFKSDMKPFESNSYVFRPESEYCINLIVIIDNTKYNFEKCRVFFLSEKTDSQGSTDIYFEIRALKSTYTERIYSSIAAYNVTAQPEQAINEISGINVDPANFSEEFFDKLADSGVKYVRLDLPWHDIEKTPGVYDFTENFDPAPGETERKGWDDIHHAIVSRGLIPLYILAYGNPLYTEVYEGVTNVDSEEERTAYKNYVAQCINRYSLDNYAALGILYEPKTKWEIWNEPNHYFFWYPQPSMIPYLTLVSEVYPLIKSIAPHAKVLAPAVDNLNPPYTFLQECVDYGMLDYCDYISCHPYRFGAPAVTIKDYWNVYSYIYGTQPQHKDKKIVSSEWGMFSQWGPYDTPEDGPGIDTLAAYIVRMFLVNAYFKIPISIWFELADSDEIEQSADYFGLLKSYTTSMAEHGVPITEKVSASGINPFQELKKLMTELNGMWFVKRLDSIEESDALLLFTDGTNYKIAYWSDLREDGEEELLYRNANLTNTTLETVAGLEHLDVQIGSLPDYTSVTLQELIDHFNYI